VTSAPSPPLADADPSCVDDPDLRDDRRARLLAAMAAHRLDVLVLGRPAEVTFASGARLLWTAGSRPFGPACVVVRETGHAHLLTVSDFDVPEEVAHDDLLGLHWNPSDLAATLGAVPGMRSARRVGTTSSSPGFGRLLAALAPDAEQVDGTAAMWEARTPKSDAEVERIAAAVALARRSLAGLVEAATSGAGPQELRALHLEALALAGAPTAPTERVAWTGGGLVALDPGAFVRGYEGGLGRTVVVDAVGSTGERVARVDAAVASVVAACRPGATGADLVAAWEAGGEPVPAGPLVLGTGLGVEPPYVSATIGLGEVLAPRTVVSVQGQVDGAHRRDLVLVDVDGPTLLTPDREDR
jgi:Xaa-Pro aminopeptidase